MANTRWMKSPISPIDELKEEPEEGIAPLMSDASYKGWTRPGPMPPGGVEIEPGETSDYLCGHFPHVPVRRAPSAPMIFSPHGSERWCPRPERIADLGSGIGSVGMVAAWRCPGATIHTVSSGNQCASRPKAPATTGWKIAITSTRAICGGYAAQFAPFDLVLGSPPYWPCGHARAGRPSASCARAWKCAVTSATTRKLR